MTTLAARLAAALGTATGARFGLAVSGGGDSMALMHLAAEAGLAAEVATVNHGLRPDAAAEAAMVAEQAAGLGFPHKTLHWRWDGTGNLPEQARLARRGLLADWAAGRQLSPVLLAHTADDLAEGLLMRLARGAGVDGLAAMPARWDQAGVTFQRPLLGVTRAELRAYLQARGLAWAEDPTNSDPVYERSRARAALRHLAPLGLSVPTLAVVAGHLAQARAALDHLADQAAHLAREHAGAALLDRAGFADLPEETRRRLLLRLLGWLSPFDHPPRGAALDRALAAILSARPATLAGTRLLPHGAQSTLILREARAMGRAVAPGALWDGRWRVNGPFAAGQTIAALGAAGLAQRPDWRDLGLPRAALLVSPAVWQGQTLIAAPLLQPERGFSAESDPPLAKVLHLGDQSH